MTGLYFAVVHVFLTSKCTEERTKEGRKEERERERESEHRFGKIAEHTGCWHIDLRVFDRAR